MISMYRDGLFTPMVTLSMVSSAMDRLKEKAHSSVSMEWSIVETGSTHRSSSPSTPPPPPPPSLSHSLRLSLPTFLSLPLSSYAMPCHAMKLKGVSYPQRHGKGRLRFMSGNVYNGEFQYNQIHGQGVMTYRNRDRYDGRWKNGMVKL